LLFGSQAVRRDPHRRAVALNVPAVFTQRKRATWPAKSVGAADQLPERPADDDRKPAIVTTTSRKRLKLLRAEEPLAQRDNEPEAAARMRAWLERAKWGHGPSR
jgi:hypothetical protein